MSGTVVIGIGIRSRGAVDYAIEMARALGSLPRRVVLFAVTGPASAGDRPLSPALAASVPALVERIAAELSGAAARDALPDDDAPAPALEEDAHAHLV
jgi:hypothetical protein